VQFVGIRVHEKLLKHIGIEHWVY